MTPAEHYQQAEAILAGINEESEKARPHIEKLLADDAYDQAREVVDVTARMVDLGLAQAQVHATLATVPVFPEKRLVRFGDPLVCDRCGHEHHVGPPDNRCTDPGCDCPAPDFDGGGS